MPSSRPLLPAERELLGCFAGAIDLDRVRVYGRRSAPGRVMSMFTGGKSIALGYRLFLSRGSSLPVMAHELMHVCQYESWGALSYLARGAWNQLVLRLLLRKDVYRWEPDPGKAFTDYRMEQQGQIVQDCFDVSSPRRVQAQHLSPYRPTQVIPVPP